MKAHCAVNHICEDNVYLIRIKELGKEAPTLKVNFKRCPDLLDLCKGESFIAEIGSIYTEGTSSKYIVTDNFKVVRDRKAFDVDAYMTVAEEVAEVAEEVTEGVTEEENPF